MYLPRPLALASGLLKSLLFVAISSDNVPASLTIASLDVGVRMAHLATYVGLGHSGLQLPVSSFFPAPTPTTDMEMVLYATPVTAAVWDPSVRAVEAMVKTVMKVVSNIITVDSAFIHGTIEKLIRSHDRCAGLLVRMQPVLVPTSSQELYFDCYNQSSHIRLRPQPIFGPPTLSPHLNSFTPSVPSSSIDPPLSQAALKRPKSSSGGSRLPTSAIVVLGQCTPYRMLPSQGNIVLVTDLEDEPPLEFVNSSRLLDQIILDELEEPKQAPKTFVMYKPPPCTDDNCALVVHIEPSRAGVANLDIDFLVSRLYCYIITAACTIAWVCILAYRVTCWTAQVLYGIVVWVYVLTRRIFIALVRVLRDICGRIFVSPSPGLQDTVPGPRDPPPTIPLPLSDLSTFHAAPSPAHDPSPTVVPPASDTAAQSIKSKPKSKKKKKNKKLAGKSGRTVVDPTSIPLPDDDGLWSEDAEDTMGTGGDSSGGSDNTYQPHSTVDTENPTSVPDSDLAALPPLLVSPTTPGNASSFTTVIDPATIPLPENDQDLAVAANVPRSPALGSLDPVPIESDGGGWETVTKRKPWRPFVPVPGASARPQPQETTGLKIGKGKWKRRKKV